jgi:hypothetical protein
MILINLLPEELKVKNKKSTAGPVPDKLVYIFPAVIAVMLLVHLTIGIVQIGRIVRAGVLSRRMAALEPQRRQVEGQRLLDSDPIKLAVGDFIAKSIPWSLKLNKLSHHVPVGMWFTEITVSRKDMVIRGAVVALEDDEMGAINVFMSNLRNDKDFMKGLGSIDLGPLGTRGIGSYSVTDFILTIPLVTPS